MSIHAILMPMFVQVGLTFVLLFWMGALRLRAIRQGEVLTQQLQHALNSRVVIEQAKGVLAQLGAVPMEVAFEHLRHHARRHNSLLGDVARRVVADRMFARHVLGAGVR